MHTVRPCLFALLARRLLARLSMAAHRRQPPTDWRNPRVESHDVYSPHGAPGHPIGVTPFDIVDTEPRLADGCTGSSATSAASSATGAASADPIDTADMAYFSTLVVQDDQGTRQLLVTSYAVLLEPIRRLWDSVLPDDVWPAMGLPHVSCLSEFLRVVDFNAIIMRPSAKSMLVSPVSLWYYVILFVERQLLRKRLPVYDTAALMLRVCLFSRDNIFVSRDCRAQMEDSLRVAIGLRLVVSRGSRVITRIDSTPGTVPLVGHLIGRPESRAGEYAPMALAATTMTGQQQQQQEDPSDGMLVCVTAASAAATACWSDGWSGTNMATRAAAVMGFRAQELMMQGVHVPPHYNWLFRVFTIFRSSDARRVASVTPRAIAEFNKLPLGTRFDVSCIIGQAMTAPYCMTVASPYMNDSIDAFVFSDLLSDAECISMDIDFAAAS